MIYYVTTKNGAWCTRNFMLRHGRPIRDRLAQVLYEDLPTTTSLPGGTYIFTALDMLSDAQRELAITVWDQLAEAGDAVRLLNDPRRVLLRTPLLQTLAETGRNDFRAFPATDLPDDLRFPVFIREANQHSGLLGDLITSRRELDVALRAIQMLGFRRRDALVIEFLDVSDDAGVFRKYSAFFLDGHVLPRLAGTDTDWVVKHGHVAEAHKEEELAYIRTNPHEEPLREVAALSGTDYGRVDYGVYEGRVQVWEINTNPAFGFSPRKPTRGPANRHPAVEEGKAYFYERFRRMLCDLDDRPPGDVPIHIPASVRRRLRREQPVFRLVQAARFAGHKFLHSRKQPIPAFRKLALPAVYRLAALLTPRDRSGA